ncbi:MAG: protein kinase [Polyangiaceae bacterium]
MTSPSLRSSATAFLATVEATIAPRTSLRDASLNQASREEAFLRILEDIPSQPPRLEFRETLGEGSMGIVRLALQPSVGREVAVKTLRTVSALPEPTGVGDGPRTLPPGGMRLLEEAWVTGAIEHPNVVPIYDIGRDEHGSPLIVMRRIAGRSWSSALADHEAKAKLGEEAFRESNLRTLAQVANAVAAAHAQGIIHRDLKPENVMLGQYGEVYVVDWGLAVLVNPSKHAHLPTLGARRPVVGTPCYMAPEMLAGDASMATDVYLLGAIAFEVVTGAPPHDRATLGEAFESILASPPTMPSDLDPALSTFLGKALAREAKDRYATAREFSEALEHYLMTRASVHTAMIGLLEVAELERVAATESGASSAQVEGLFGAASFSLRAALRQWSDNTDAQQGLVRAYLAAGRFALRSDDPERARTIATSAPNFVHHDDRILALAKDAENASRERRARLETLARRGDLDSGLRTRGFISTTVAFAWVVVTALSWWHQRTTGHPFAHEVLKAAALQVLLWGLLTRVAHGPMQQTDFNRKVVRAGYAVPAFLAALALLLGHVGYTDTQIFQVAVLVFCCAMACVTIFVGQRIYVFCTIILCIAGACAIEWPEWRHLGALCASLGAFATSLLVGLKAQPKSHATKL